MNNLFPIPTAKPFQGLHFNTDDLEYQVSTKACLQVIQKHPEGISLTDIVKELVPSWSDEDCKRQFKRAIDPLIWRDEVRYSEHKKSGRRDLYFPTKVSKRYVVKELFKLLKNAKLN